jgi:hypothetical protein
VPGPPLSLQAAARRLLRDPRELLAPPGAAAHTAPRPSGASSCARLEAAVCTLETRDLWQKFFQLGTEMIITKSGRRMFPTVRASFRHLPPHQSFLVLLDIIPMDNKRYR